MVEGVQFSYHTYWHVMECLHFDQSVLLFCVHGLHLWGIDCSNAPQKALTKPGTGSRFEFRRRSYLKSMHLGNVTKWLLYLYIEWDLYSCQHQHQEVKMLQEIDNKVCFLQNFRALNTILKKYAMKYNLNLDPSSWIHHHLCSSQTTISNWLPANGWFHHPNPAKNTYLHAQVWTHLLLTCFPRKKLVFAVTSSSRLNWIYQKSSPYPSISVFLFLEVDIW